MHAFAHSACYIVLHSARAIGINARVRALCKLNIMSADMAISARICASLKSAWRPFVHALVLYVSSI